MDGIDASGILLSSLGFCLLGQTHTEMSSQHVVAHCHVQLTDNMHSRVVDYWVPYPTGTDWYNYEIQSSRLVASLTSSHHQAW